MKQTHSLCLAWTNSVPLCSRQVARGSLAWGDPKETGGFLGWKDHKDPLAREACRENRAPPACLGSRALPWVLGSPWGFPLETPSHGRERGGRARPQLLSSMGPALLVPATCFLAQPVGLPLNNVLFVVLCTNWLLSFLSQGRAPTDQHIKQVCMRVIRGKYIIAAWLFVCFKGGGFWILVISRLFYTICRHVQ